MTRGQSVLRFGLRSAPLLCALALLAGVTSASAQVDPRRGPPGCVPVSERKADIGCYILVSESLGELAQRPLYWHIASYPDRKAAESAKRPHATVVEALDQVWLMAIEEKGWRPPGGAHVAEIGPLVVKPGVRYTALYMQGIMLPGAQTGVHHHPGPEACTRSRARNAWKPWTASSWAGRAACLS
jgi:hypothetical protein